MKRRNAAMPGNMFRTVSRKTKKISWLRKHEIRVRKVIRANELPRQLCCEVVHL